MTANPRNEKRKRRSLAHVDDRGRCRRTDDQANVAVAVGSLGHVRDAEEQRSAVGIEVLQVLRARVRAAAHDVHAAVFVSSELLQRVHAEVGAHGRRVHRQRREDRVRVSLHRVAHVAPLRVQQERCLCEFLVELDQRLPAVGPVLLPERAVRLEAAGVLLGLAGHLAAVAQCACGSAVDSLRVGVQPDAKHRPALFGERAQSFEEGHQRQW